MFLFYAAAFLIPFVIGTLLTPRFVELAFKTDLLDYPEGRKSHKKPMPFLGGVIIFISFWCVIFGGLLLAFMLRGRMDLLHSLPPLFWDVIPWLPEIIGVFAGSLVVLILGIWDDRFNLSPAVKFLGQSIAAVILLAVGLHVNLVQPLGAFGYFVTFFWIILLMNAFNFIDSIDGHCSGVALISACVFFFLTLIIRQAAVSFLVLIFAGALFGFFRFNTKPARCFLGDNGSLFIGYMMSVITLLCHYHAKPYSSVSPFIPILMFGVPIYDTLSVVAVRIFRGIPPWKGDRNHFAHRLVRLGMGEKNAALFSYFIALTLGLVALLTTQMTTFLGNLLVILLFFSIISIIALLEYYVTVRVSIIQKMAERQRRRRGDIQEFENRADE